ncbi:hypothetical protein [Tenacibaculum singaporense]|uniref:Uncharacterized protein n=1 Tax=Tenacibaculum singaporense TaxID=2358479 RepID=A0A3Q8RPR3_9FLAO|nr:hypothetical protein [Tenacibaculum singaporense]AZJ36616.1 hypothetical protein D6T69_14180 [Tenacibaculum singaporense]
MTKEYNKNELFRLAAVLYADNNYEVSTKVIHRKILDSALLDCDNTDLTIHSLIDYIDDKYSILLGEDEIFNIVKKYPESFLTNNLDGKKTICLSPKRKTNLESKIEKKNIEFFINQYSLEFKTKIGFKNTIYDFLYHLFSINTASFQRLIDKQKDISSVISLQDSKYNEEQIEYINSFLNWENTEKNKAIFDISSYALEFCLLTNKKGSSNFKLNNLKNKIFYLDTNVIYRAIGINGEDRRKRTITFLNKFKDAGEQLKITRISDEEFKNSIKFYIDKLRKIHNPKVNSNLFLEYKSLKDINSYYHNWRKDKINSNLELFEAYVISEYRTLLDRLGIEIDYNVPYKKDDKEVQESINDLYASINKSKPEEKQAYFQSVLNDAENIYWIEQKRKGKVENIFDTSFFFISTDNFLRKWDYYRGFTTPVVLLPSQWMSILLRYFDRTKDDYKSFVSFLNLKNNEKIIDGEKLNLILSGISEMTSSVEQQRYLVTNLIEKDFSSIIKTHYTDKEIIEHSKLYAKTELEKQVSDLSEKVSVLEKDQVRKGQVINSTIKTAKNKKDENKELESEIFLKNKKNKELKDELINLKVSKGIRRWRNWLWLYLPTSLFILLFYVFAIFFNENRLNFGKNILNFIDTRQSEALKNFLSTVFYLPLAACGWLIWRSILRYKSDNVEYKRKELKTKIEETIA